MVLPVCGDLVAPHNELGWPRDGQKKTPETETAKKTL